MPRAYSAPAGAARPWILVCALAAGSLLAACQRAARPDPPVAQGWHRVARGETLGSVAQRYRVSLADLVTLNEIDDPNRILEGQLLFLPTPRPARAPAAASRAARTLRPRSGRSPTRAAGDPIAPREISDDLVDVALDWPVLADVSSPFGPRGGRPHEGIDLRVPDGTPVRASADGVVAYAGEGLRGYGRLVILQHDNALVTVYAHNSELLVGEGERVSRGQVIARSGHTGRATAPHLHFEVREDGVPQDPGPFLRGRR